MGFPNFRKSKVVEVSHEKATIDIELAARDKEVQKKALAIIAKLVQVTKQLTAKDIDDWRKAHQYAINWENPKRYLLYRIYDDCVLDLHLTGAISNRKEPVLQKKFKIVNENGEENPDATKLLETSWFMDFMDLAWDSIIWGHSLIQFGDIINNNGKLSFSDVELVDREHVCPEYGVLLPEISDDPKTSKAISYREGQIADWCIEVGKPKNLGLLLKLAPHCISKRHISAFWDQFGELFGIPMRIATTASRDSAERSKIETALDSMGSALWALLPEGTGIEIKESQTRDSYQVFDKRIDRANKEMSKGILGGTMTIDDGSSRAQSEVHERGLEYLIYKDATFLKNEINDKLIPFLIKHGWPLNNLWFDWDDSYEYTPTEMFNIETMLLNHYEIDPEYFNEKYNVKITGIKQTGFNPGTGNEPDEKKN